MELIDKMFSGDQIALARLITILENQSQSVPEIMKAIYPHIGNAYLLGITGPPQVVAKVHQ